MVQRVHDGALFPPLGTSPASLVVVAPEGHSFPFYFDYGRSPLHRAGVLVFCQVAHIPKNPTYLLFLIWSAEKVPQCRVGVLFPCQVTHAPQNLFSPISLSVT